MPEQGKAAIVRQLDGTFRVEAVEFGEPLGREVLVEVRAAGLCHSDLNVASIDRGRRLPLVAGHELAGVVVATGPDVERLRVGDHVVGTEVRACGACAACLTGRPTVCEHPDAVERDRAAAPRITQGGERIHTLGVSAFATWSIADERQFVRIPDDVPFAEASLLGCGVSTGVGAVVNVAGVAPGETVAVFGLGGVGLSIVAGAVLSGATEIIAIDVEPAKLELALALGATHAIRSGEVEVEAAVREIVPLGVDHAFDAAGARAVAPTALRSLARGGGLYLIGIPRPGELLELDTMRDVIGHQRMIRGVYMGGTNPQRDIPRYAEFYRQGRLPLEDLLSERVAIDEINRAYHSVPAHGARAVITDFS